MEILVIVFFAAAILQIIYFIFFLIAFLNTKRQKPSPGNEPVSVIVCAHDEEQNLRELIPMLVNQDYPAYEIIVIDDRSNDDTWSLLWEENQKHARLKIISIDKTPEKFNPKKYGLTLGIKAAQYEKIIFTDADCRPAGRLWISCMMASFDQNTDIVLGYSPYYRKKGLLNRFIRFEALITAIQYMSCAVAGMPYMGVGRNLAYRKSLFINNKGFHGILHVTGGDDDLFVNRYANGKNTNVCVGGDSIVFSIPKTTWRSFFEQKLRHLSVGKLYKPVHRLILGFFTTSHIVTLFLGLPLVVFYDSYWIGALLLLRLLLLMTVVYTAGKKLGDKISVWAVLFLDFIYAFYYISTGLTALLTKKVQWRS